jgi:hypothetical protein
MGAIFNPQAKMTDAMQAGLYYARRKNRAFRTQEPLETVAVPMGPDGAWSGIVGGGARDTSGSGYNLTSATGTVTSGADPIPASLGDWTVDSLDAMVFDGASNLAYTSPINAFNFGVGDFAINLWMNAAGGWGDANTVGVIGQKALDSYGGWQIYQDSGAPGTPRLRAAASGGVTQTDITSTIPVIAGTWTMITVQRQNGTFYWFINGVAAGSLSASINIMTDDQVGADFQIGFASTWSAFYQGALWDIEIWNRALVPDDIAELYSNPPVSAG